MSREEKCCYTVVATQGTSPGVVPELLYNVSKGGVKFLEEGVVRRVYILATSHPQVLLAAWTAAKIIECCGVVDRPPRVELITSSVDDVVDKMTYDAFYADVRERLERLAEEASAADSREPRCANLVLLDVTGGRVGMALAAFEAAESVYTRGRLVVTTTQVPPEYYQELGQRFRGMADALRELMERELRGERIGCGELERRAPGVCSLVTRRAVSSVLRVWDTRHPCVKL